MPTLTRNVLFIAVAITVTLLGAAAGNAATIMPANNSFESPTITAAPWYLFEGPTSWQSAGSIYIKHLNSDATIIGETDNQWIDIVAAETPTPGTKYALVVQNLADTISPNTQYRLLVDLTTSPAAISAGYAMTGAQSELYLRAASSDTTFSSLTVAGSDLDALGGQFTTYATPWIQPDVSLVGDAFRIVIANTTTNQGAAPHSMSVDNVRIETTTVPEPTGIALMVLGLFSLLASGWKKQK